MIDDILLTAITRFWSESQVRETYDRILTAYIGRTDAVTIITSKGNDGSIASGQIVIQKADYREWMATLEARLAQIEATAAGTGAVHPDVEHVDFSRRYLCP